MRDLGRWWPFARTVWGWSLAGLSGLAAAFYGPKKALETYDWYLDRLYDHRVKDHLQQNVSTMSYISPNGLGQIAKAISVSEIADACKLSEKRTLKCLKRLRLKDVVTEDKNGCWKLNIPPFGSF